MLFLCLLVPASAPTHGGARGGEARQTVLTVSRGTVGARGSQATTCMLGKARMPWFESLINHLLPLQ